MKLKIHGAELNHMMKTIGQCIDPKHTTYANIQIMHKDNLLSIRSTNGVFRAVTSTPIMGGDGESFAVDGQMFKNVVSMCSGEVEIASDERNCVVKGAGRTRLPVVDAEVPELERVDGQTVVIKAKDFCDCYGKVSYAVATDQSRIVLTGVLVETDGQKMKMVAVDGFQMAIESVPCEGETISAIIPGTFMRLIASIVSGDELLKITVDGKRVQVETEGLLIASSLISGDFIDYKKILPESFVTDSLVNTEQVKNALKSSSVINSKQKLVKFEVSEDEIRIMSNSELADFEMEIPCETHGEALTIAFNERYIINTMNVIGEEEAVFSFNSAMTPAVVKGKGSDGVHLTLPVRTHG